MREESPSGALEIATMTMGNPAFAEVHLVHLFSFHESWLRGSNVLGWSKEKWPRLTPSRRLCIMWETITFSPPSVTRRPSLPPPYPPSFLQSEKLLSSSSWFHPFPFFSSLFWISSLPSIPSFPTKNPSLQCAVTPRYYCQRSVPTNHLEQVLCGFSNTIMHVNHLGNGVRTQSLIQ